MKKRHFNIPVFVPHIGCPHDCVFCNQHHITGSSKQITGEDVRRIIDEHLKYIDKDSSFVEVAFFGGSFTAIEPGLQTELMAAANGYIKDGKVDSLRCSTRPDCIDEKILANLKKYGMKTIELGVQSTDSDVLLKSGRGHGRDEVFAASRLIKEKGFSLGLQMMLGLPGDTRDKSIKTAEDIISLAPDCVRIYPTLVVDDTALSKMYEKGEYTPISLEYAVDLCAELIEKFEAEDIEVIRIGLQTTDNINEQTVKGPYHNAIGELSYGRVHRNRIEKTIQREKIRGDFTYFVPEGEISKAIGHKKCNIEYFKDKYNVNLKVEKS